MPFIQTEMIRLNQSFNTSAEAIDAAGEVLEAAGCVSPAYVKAMHEHYKRDGTFVGEPKFKYHDEFQASAKEKTGDKKDKGKEE